MNLATLLIAQAQAASETEKHVESLKKSVALGGTTWSYQAMPNIIDFASVAFNTTFTAGLLGWGDVAFQGPTDDFTGTLGATPKGNGVGGVLNVTGSLVDGTFRMRAHGDIFNECENKTFPWVYDYIGYLTPIWVKPEQVVGGDPSVGARTIVGSVIREIEHPGTGPCPMETHVEGQTGSFWMVLHQDSLDIDVDDVETNTKKDDNAAVECSGSGSKSLSTAAILVLVATAMF